MWFSLIGVMVTVISSLIISAIAGGYLIRSKFNKKCTMISSDESVHLWDECLFHGLIIK